MVGETLRPRVETGAQQVRVEQGPQNSRKLLYIPGITNSHIRGLPFQRAFTTEYGEGNVNVTNSMISTDVKDPKRWSDMADYIMASAPDGIDIAVHSLGAAELYRAIKIIEKRDKDFFRNQTDKSNIHFVFVDPSGFNKGLGQKLDYARRTVGLVREHANQGISKKNTLHRGIDALVAFPPEGFDQAELQGLAEGVRKIFPPNSTPQERADLERIAFTDPKDHEAYKFQYLSFEQRADVARYDGLLKAAFTQGELENARRIIIERGEILKGALDHVYMGTLDTDQREPKKMRMGGPINATRMFFTAMGKRPMGKFRQLLNMGYDVDFLSPENSIAVPLARVLQIFDSTDQQAAQHVKIAELFTHPSITSQPESMAKMIRGFRNADGILAA